jgi:DNA mismatch repair ATPase MutL
MVLNQQRAMERILFEEFLKHQGGSGNSQQLLYPVTFEVNQADLSLLEGMLRN